MDLQLAEYKAGKFGFSDPRAFDHPFKNKRAVVAMSNNHKYNEMLKNIRHNTAQKQEGHDKQLALMVNRRRFAQNVTWQTEYDRLASHPGAPDGRLDQLKSLILGNQPYIKT